MLFPQLLSERFFLPDYLQRKRTANAKEHEWRPLPAKRVDKNYEDVPVDQFGVSEEVKRACRSQPFHKARKVDPCLHPTFRRPR